MPGLTYVGNYSPGPGISDPSPVFGLKDAIQQTNDRLDQWSKQQHADKVQKQVRLAKMLGDLDVKPTGMYEKDVPNFVQAKQQLEQFYTEAQLRGTDPDNPRFIAEYTKAKTAKDLLQGMVAQSINRNKSITQAAQDLLLHPDKYDADAAGKYLKDRADQSLPDYVKNGPIELPKKQFDKEKWMQDNLTGPKGFLNKPSTESELIGTAQKPYDAKRADALQQKKNDSGLDDAEKQELAELKKVSDYNQKAAKLKNTAGNGAVDVQKSTSYGEPIEFDIKNTTGGDTPFTTLPKGAVDGGRAALQNPEMANIYNKRLANLNNGTNDITGQVPVISDPNNPGKFIPDPIAQDAYRQKYRNIVEAAGTYTENGQPMDGVELYAAMDVNEHLKHTSAISDAIKYTPGTTAYAHFYNSAAGQALEVKRSLMGSLAETTKNIFSGSSAIWQIGSDGQLHAPQFIADDKTMGAPYVDAQGKKHPNTIIDMKLIIDPQTGVKSVGVQTLQSLKSIPANMRSQYDAIVADMDQLKGNDAFYDPKNKVWLNSAKEKEYQQLVQKEKELMDKGGAGYKIYGPGDGKAWAYDYLGGNVPPNEVTTMQSLFDTEAQKIGSYTKKGDKYSVAQPKGVTYNSQEKSALQAQLQSNTERMNDVGTEPEKQKLRQANASIQDRIDKINAVRLKEITDKQKSGQSLTADEKKDLKELGGKEGSAKTISLKDAKAANPKFKGTDAELIAKYKGHGYDVK